MIAIFELNRINNESEESYIWRLGQAKDNGVIDYSWEQLAELINKEFRNDETEYRTESAYRKAYSQAKRFFDSGVLKTSSNADYLEELAEQKRELERLKIQYRDERKAWQKQNYVAARVDHKLNELENRLSELGRQNFETHEKVEVSSDNDMLVLLSDFHIGANYNSLWGIYNSGIAAQRLGKLLEKVIEIQKMHNSEKCYCCLLGDVISGSIHKTIAIANRENVIEQIKIATELISSFCYELTKHFKVVFLSSVVGNHSRIDKKDDALHDERLDSLIDWSVGLSLQHIDNFHLLKRNLDVGIADIDIRGKYYLAIHGDYDPFNKSGVSNLCTFVGFVPYAILYGHLHTCALDEVNGIKMIRGGSLGGSGDQYTIEKRLSGSPSQMVCVCDDKGVRCCYPINLS